MAIQRKKTDNKSQGYMLASTNPKTGEVRQMYGVFINVLNDSILTKNNIDLSDFLELVNKGERTLTVNRMTDNKTDKLSLSDI